MLLQPLAVFVLVLSLIKGAQFPHPWAATQAWFNYDYGFVKRALFGTVARALGGTFQGYRGYFCFSLVVMVATAVLLVPTFKALHQRERSWLRAAPLLYASSIAVAYLASSIGYVDHLGLLVTLVALRIGSFWRRMLFMTLGFGLLLFMHEATLVIFVPVALFASLLDAREDKRRALSLLGLGVGLAVVTLLVSNATIAAADAKRMFVEARGAADFWVERRAFEVLARSGAANFAIMGGAWNDGRYVADMIFSWLATAPTMMALLWIGARELRRSRVGWRWVLLGIAAALSPLSLHLIAWDVGRWNALAVTTSFLLVVAVARQTEPPASAEAPASRPVLLMALGLLVLNLSSTTWFLDSSEVELFPFPRHVTYLRRVMRGHEEFPRRPLELMTLAKLSGKRSPYAKWLRPK
jgi:hypothetical protein